MYGTAPEGDGPFLRLRIEMRLRRVKCFHYIHSGLETGSLLLLWQYLPLFTITSRE